MRNKCPIINFLLIVLMFAATSIYAQETHRYTLSFNQPPPLLVDAGDDITSFVDDVETLGGNPVATGGTAPYTYLWTPAQNLSDDQVANPEVIIGSTDLSYTVTVTDANGCTSSDGVAITTLITALKEEAHSTINVYPNPVNDWLSIQTGENRGTITLIDTQGKEVLKETIKPSRHSIDFRNFQKGIYLLKVQTEQSVSTFQLMVR